jgi:hypothetical protein
MLLEAASIEMDFWGIMAPVSLGTRLLTAEEMDKLDRVAQKKIRANVLSQCRAAISNA